jgi:hypothetical protein
MPLKQRGARGLKEFFKVILITILRFQIQHWNIKYFKGLFVVLLLPIAIPLAFELNFIDLQAGQGDQMSLWKKSPKM